MSKYTVCVCDNCGYETTNADKFQEVVVTIEASHSMAEVDLRTTIHQTMWCMTCRRALKEAVDVMLAQRREAQANAPQPPQLR